MPPQRGCPRERGVRQTKKAYGLGQGFDWEGPFRDHKKKLLPQARVPHIHRTPQKQFPRRSVVLEGKRFLWGQGFLSGRPWPPLYKATVPTGRVPQGWGVTPHNVSSLWDRVSGPDGPVPPMENTTEAPSHGQLDTAAMTELTLHLEDAGHVSGQWHTKPHSWTAAYAALVVLCDISTQPHHEIFNRKPHHM